ncbi:MAG: hypothetical protein FWH02_01540 [Oscillospiraceae bacterium]|nr:hypothetical protein [Oscillospiraceae bacterium]
MARRKILYSITDETEKGIQFGSGLILKNFEYQDIETMAEFQTAYENAVSSGQALGAIDGGANINISVTYGRPSIDGLGMFPFKGMELPESLECYITVTLKEFSPDKIQSVFGTSRFAYGGGDVVSQRINAAISPEDYYDNITWLGSTNFGYIQVTMFNVLGKTDGAITAPNGIAGGGIPFRADGNLESFKDTEFIPAEIRYYYTTRTDLEAVLERIESHRITLPTAP